MASDGVPVTVPASLVAGSQGSTLTAAQPASGKSLPAGGNNGVVKSASTAAAAAAASARAADSRAKNATATNKADLKSLVAQLNKYLNDSGRPYQFRVDPTSRNQTIQEINPSSGEVIGEFSSIEFPALARSLGVSGVLVDDRA